MRWLKIQPRSTVRFCLAEKTTKVRIFQQDFKKSLTRNRQAFFTPTENRLQDEILPNNRYENSTIE